MWIQKKENYMNIDDQLKLLEQLINKPEPIDATEIELVHIHRDITGSVDGMLQNSTPMTEVQKNRLLDLLMTAVKNNTAKSFMFTGAMDGLFNVLLNSKIDQQNLAKTIDGLVAIGQSKELSLSQSGIDGIKRILNTIKIIVTARHNIGQDAQLLAMTALQNFAQKWPDETLAVLGEIINSDCIRNLTNHELAGKLLQCVAATVENANKNKGDLYIISGEQQIEDVINADHNIKYIVQNNIIYVIDLSGKARQLQANEEFQRYPDYCLKNIVRQGDSIPTEQAITLTEQGKLSLKGYTGYRADEQNDLRARVRQQGMSVLEKAKEVNRRWSDSKTGQSTDLALALAQAQIAVNTPGCSNAQLFHAVKALETAAGIERSKQFTISDAAQQDVVKRLAALLVIDRNNPQTGYAVSHIITGVLSEIAKKTNNRATLMTVFEAIKNVNANAPLDYVYLRDLAETLGVIIQKFNGDDVNDEANKGVVIALQINLRIRMLPNKLNENTSSEEVNKHIKELIDGIAIINQSGEMQSDIMQVIASRLGQYMLNSEGSTPENDLPVANALMTMIRQQANHTNETLIAILGAIDSVARFANDCSTLLVLMGAMEILSKKRGINVASPAWEDTCGTIVQYWTDVMQNSINETISEEEVTAALRALDGILTVNIKLGNEGEDICSLVKALKHLSDDYPDVATPEIIKNLLDKALMIVENEKYVGSASDDIKEMQQRLNTPALLLECGLLENGDNSFTKAQLAQFNNAHHKFLPKFMEKLQAGSMRPEDFINMLALPNNENITQEQLKALELLIENHLLAEGGVNDEQCFTINQVIQFDDAHCQLLNLFIEKLQQGVMAPENFIALDVANLLGNARETVFDDDVRSRKLEEISKNADLCEQYHVREFPTIDTTTQGVINEVVQVTSVDEHGAQFTHFHDRQSIERLHQVGNDRDPITNSPIQAIVPRPDLTRQLNEIIINLAQDPNHYDDELGLGVHHNVQ